MSRVTSASHMLIGGDLVASESGQWIDSVDPATEEVIGCIPAGDARDVARAVEAADRAWEAWNGIGVAARAEALRAFGEKMLARAERTAGGGGPRHR